MIKFFCDGCGKQINQENVCFGGTLSTGRLGTEIEKGKYRLGVEVIISKNGTSNDGHWCKYCVLDALYKLDDRPRKG